jgi:SAM-dependent methyltransferase
MGRTLNVMAVYDTIGRTYSATRATEPAYEAAIHATLGDDPILNVGAGTGSYEPAGRDVIAVEPSAVMIAQRPPASAPVVQAIAEALPFPDDTFGSAMGVLTVHHWTDPERGLAEVRRVTRGPIALVATDVAVAARAWLLADYFPDHLDLFGEIDANRVARIVGADRVDPLTTPHDCRDGFFLAYWRRPEAYLDPAVRAGISWFATLGAERSQRFVDELDADLRSGRWHRRNGHLLALDRYDAGHRLVLALS